MARKLRISAVSQLHAGKKKLVLFNSLYRRAARLSGALAQELCQCTSFQEASEHARACLSRLSFLDRIRILPEICRGYFERTGELAIGPGAIRRMLANLIEDLCEKKLFVSLSSLAEQTDGKASTPVAKIDEIAFVSSNRPASLEASLESYLRHTRAMGREVSFAVHDGSLETATQEKYRQLLKQVAKKNNVRISYAGLTEKENFAKLLVTRGIPEQVVRFGLFGVNSPYFSRDGTYGANRNALLLHSVGKLVLSSDDDVFCEVSRPKSYSDRVRVGGHTNQPDFFLHPKSDRQAALAAVQPCSDDILEVHERFLGRKVNDCLAAVGDESQIEYEDSSVFSLRALQRKQAHIVLTFNGIVGDLGSASPPPVAFTEGKQREIILADEKTFNLLHTGREVTKSPTQVVIKEAMGCMTTVLGMDNREILPPFFPLFRNEDAVFGHTLRASATNEYFACLPWLLLHSPPERRAYDCSPIMPRWFAPPDAVMACIESFRGTWSRQDFARKIRMIGEHLVACGTMPLDEFDEYMTEYAMLERSKQAFACEDLLRRFPKSPSYWVSHMKKLRDVTYEHMLDEVLYTDAMLVKELGRDGAMQLLQHLVRDFGELMTWWPEMVKMSRELQASGLTLAVALN